MSDIAIRCEGLSKQYRIGKRERYKALRDTLTDALSAPFRAVRSAFNGHRQAGNGAGNHTIWALNDVSFEIKHGEVVGIIGRNGAGKSTLLKILSRITEPTKGQAEIHGRVGSLLEVGTGFHPELTGRENVYLNGAILGIKKAEIERNFDQIVAFAEVEKFIDTPVKRYSSGMGVRLAFAVAAHLEPEVLLVDEVLAVGDIAFQKKCLNKMGDVAREGRTVLFVSHNMGAIKALCPLAILLEGGQVAGYGATVDIVQTYLQQYTGLETEVSLKESKPHRRGGNFRIERVAIMDSNGSPSAQIPFGCPFQVVLELTLERKVSGLHVGLGIATPDGTRVTTTHHSDTIHITDFQDRRILFRCQFQPNLFIPGIYYLHVGAHAEDSLGTDYVPEALAFEVLPISVDDADDFKPRNFGLFKVPARWFIETKE
jgi:lipopolysaccharide transport system ATP-binding protein